MGFYIETPGHKQGKASILIREHDATLLCVSGPGKGILPALDRIVNDEKYVLIAVVENATYDAAMIVYDDRELDRIKRSIDGGDPRTIYWLSMDPLVVKRLNVNVPMVD